MSYGFTVTRKDGQLEIGPGYGDLPDGTWEVSGHLGAPETVAGGAQVVSRSIQITERDEAGALLIGAQHSETRPQ